MISENTPIKERIIVEKIHADGTHELIGDTGFEKVYDKDKILLLLDLMDIDLNRKKRVMELIKEENYGNYK